MNTRIRIAQIRVVPEKGNLKANHERLMSILGEVAGQKTDVVVTPECFIDGYVATEANVSAEELGQYAIDPLKSDYTRAISKWASEASAWVILGCSRISADGVYNTAMIFDRKGVLVGMYDKIHCQTHDKKYIPGRSLRVFDSDFGLFGVIICADRRCPETVRSLALQGARIISNPTYGMHDERNLHMMQTRSYESEVFIAFTHPKQSLLTDPTGRIVCDDARKDAHYSVNEIDLTEVDRVRRNESSHLKDRRPDVYVC